MSFQKNKLENPNNKKMSRRKLLAVLGGVSLAPVLGVYGLKISLKSDSFQFAAIGDYGTDRKGKAAKVAALIKSWDPDYIITLGDNNYRQTETDNIDANVGKLFQEYIYPYKGQYGTGSPDKTNKFWPALGNHDYDDGGIVEYLDYFELPNNGRYYDVKIGPVHLFCINTEEIEDGVEVNSKQAEWLKRQLSSSKADWKLVYMHRAPFNSGHGGVRMMRWPYAEWGATAVLSGHVHNYERLENDGIPYFVNGLGGNSKYRTIKIHPFSRVRYFLDHGAMRISGNTRRIVFDFVNIDGVVIDRHEIVKPGFWRWVRSA